jgi:hypothetical protein
MEGEEGRRRPDRRAGRLIAQLLIRIRVVAAMRQLKILIFVAAAVALAAGGASAQPMRLSSVHQDGIQPQIAIDPTGRTTVVWDAPYGHHHVVQVATRPAGGPRFDAPVNLSVDARETFDPRVVVDRAGDATLVWIASTGRGRPVVQAVTRRAGGSTFASPVTLSDPAYAANAAFKSDALSVASNANGDMVVAWQAHRVHGDPYSHVVQAATRTAGGSFSAPVTLSDPAHDAQDPVAAIDAHGDATVAWDNDTHADAPFVQVATRQAGGRFTGPVTLSGTGDDAFSPTVAMDGAGNAVAVWHVLRAIEHPTDPDENTRFVLQAATRPAGGTFGSPVTISNAALNSEDPELAFDPAGNLTVVWAEGTLSRGTAVQAVTLPAGRTTFTRPVTLPHQIRDAEDPHVVFDRRGNALVVWLADDGIEIPKAALRAARSSHFSAPFRLARPLESAMENAAIRVAIDAAGRATVVWDALDGHDAVETTRFSLAAARARHGLSVAPAR